jgi:hypothetical protein
MSWPKSNSAVPGARRSSTPPGGDTSTPSTFKEQLEAINRRNRKQKAEGTERKQKDEAQQRTSAVVADGML